MPGGITRRALAFFGAFLTGSALCAPLGVAHYYSLLAGGLCTCDESPAGDAIGMVAFSIPATGVSLVLGAPVWWLASRRWPGRIAALAAGSSPLGAAPYAAIAFIAFMYFAPSPGWLWLVGALAILLGATTSGAVWRVLSLGVPHVAGLASRTPRAAEDAAQLFT